ncbi:MAG: DEAD/DEAH box helicase [bacterium]|nr:DEAD/DEAH box helicase [bacterium]
MTQTQTLGVGFSDLGIAPGLLDTLSRLKLVEPTPIQHQAIPIAIQGKDVVGIAQTGTGKTLAFGIPLVQLLLSRKGQGLVILPTRELALQVDESLRHIGHSQGIRTAVVIGGTSFGPQLRALSSRPHVVIGTPGRLNDLIEKGKLKLHTTSIVVLDEADRMLDMGFLPQLVTILQELPEEHQTMLFSATMPPEIMKLASKHMKLPVRVEVAPAGTTVETVTHELVILSREQKPEFLQHILLETLGSVLVFTRTKFAAQRMARDLRVAKISAAEIHSDRSLYQRREALEGFKSGKHRVLVATDIAARGIDVKGIALVVNYDMPDSVDNYVHRIGRTARAGTQGRAITFATPTEQRDVRSIERAIHKSFMMTRLPGSMQPVRFQEQSESRAPRRAPYGSRDSRGGSRYGRSQSGHGSSRGRSPSFQKRSRAS